MPIEVKMGAISPTMSSGQIVEWKVKVGDTVKEGMTIADVQTDKAVMPLESFDEGVVAVLLAEPGQEVPVGDNLLILAKKGEDPKAVAASAGKGTVSAPPAVAKTSHEATATPSKPAESSVGTNGHAAPAAAPEPVAAGATGGRVKSSPLARKIAASEGISLDQVPPSGPGGRVVRSDVESFAAARKSAPAAAKPGASKPAFAPRGDVRIELTRMRKTIADRMVQAKQQAPEIHVTVDIRVDQIVAIRERLNASLSKEKIKLSVGDFVTKAVALALRKHPGVNATFVGDAIIQHGDVNVGIAVALDGGLIVPVLRNADLLGLKEIRTGSETLYEAARSMKLTSDQMTGGTFTISNLGMYGVHHFDAILNLPQVGILAVGAAEKRPVVVGDKLEIGTVMTVNLTADHRAVDGALAAEFLKTLKGLLEEPASMLL